jgi:D-alanine--D-alanine ligase
LIIEEEIKGREIEFVVLETSEGPIVFHPGEILTEGKIYSYEAKCGENAFGSDPQAKIPQEISKAGQQLTKKLFKLLDGRGYARVDFFLTQEGELFFNEVNPIPGFTKISLLPKIAAVNGYPIEKLTSHLVSLCLHHAREDKNLRHVPT